MARFVYKARDADGKLVRDRLRQNKGRSHRTLRERGLRVTSIQPAAKTFSLLSASTQSKPMKARLCGAGPAVGDSAEAGFRHCHLQLLEEQSKDKRLAKALNTMR